MKLKLILTILLPLLDVAIFELRNKDENSTGFDDIAANQIEAAKKSLQDYINPPLPV